MTSRSITIPKDINNHPGTFLPIDIYNVIDVAPKSHPNKLKVFHLILVSFSILFLSSMPITPLVKTCFTKF